jgi:hypothetical protein
MVSAFVGGAVFGGIAGTTTTSVLTAGTLSGVSENIVDQSMDMMAGNKSEFDLESMIESGALGALSGYLSHRAMKANNAFLDKRLKAAIAEMNSPEEKDLIKAGIKETAPRIGERALNKAANEQIKSTIRSLTDQNNALKAAMKEFIEKGLDELKQKLEKALE